MKRSKTFLNALKKVESGEHLPWKEAYHLFSGGYTGGRGNLTEKGEALLAEYDMALAFLMYGRGIPKNLLGERAQKYADECPWIEYEKTTKMGQVVKDTYTLPENPAIDMFDNTAVNAAFEEICRCSPGLKDVLHEMAYGHHFDKSFRAKSTEGKKNPLVKKWDEAEPKKSKISEFMAKIPKEKIKEEFFESLEYNTFSIGMGTEMSELLNEVKEAHTRKAAKAMAIPKKYLSPLDNGQSTSEPSEAEVNAARSKLTDYLQTKWVADHKKGYVMSFRAELGEDMYITVHQDNYGRWFGGQNGPMGHEVSIESHDEPHEAAHDALESIKERILPKARALDEIEVCEEMFE